MANIFKEAKKYRDVHPRVSFQDAIQKVSGKRAVSGAKKPAAKKKVGLVQYCAPPAISGVKKKKKRIGLVNYNVPVVNVGKQPAAIGALSKGKEILKTIATLEADRRRAKTKDAKDLLSLVINKEHDKFDALKRNLKKR